LRGEHMRMQRAHAGARVCPVRRAEELTGSCCGAAATT
jgi:hypothetical protein